jgi:hypothetical protein
MAETANDAKILIYSPAVHTIVDGAILDRLRFKGTPVSNAS